jgi:hypothetical protein
MYQISRQARSAQRFVDRPSPLGPQALAASALARLRKLFNAYRPGLTFDAAHLRSLLSKPFTDAAEETERLFALGWLNRVGGDPAGAEPLLHDAVVRADQTKATDLLAAAAYWRARVRLLLKRADAVTEYENVMRKLSGSPQATAWFVDLLWRAGRVDRAEQVWKSVRTNKRVASCPEGPFLDIRAMLRRGETTPAEKLLNETTPTHCVLYGEKLLLSAWVRATQRQYDDALKLLDDVERLPYLIAAVKEWRELIGARRDNTPDAVFTMNVPVVLADLMRGHQARREGRIDEAVAAYRAALTSAAAQPFARYALAALGQDDPAALMTSQPGLFLAVRCRVLTALQKFQRREASAAELLDAIQQAANADYRSAAVEHFRQLAETLQNKQPTREELQAFVAAHAASETTIRRNVFRAALEQAVRHLSTAEALSLLGEWSRLDWLTADEALRAVVAKQILRLLLLVHRDTGEVSGETISDLESLLPGEVLPVLLRSLVAPAAPLAAVLSDASAPAAARLWLAARALQQFAQENIAPEALEAWRGQVRQLRSESRLRGLAQALLLQEAAQRSDAGAVGALLDEADYWRAFRSGPPQFVLRTLENVVSSQPAQPVWRRSLARWLQLWDAVALGPTGAALAALSGSMTVDAAIAEPPPGVPRVPWLLHQAVRALNRDDGEALTYMRRALAEEADFAALPESALVRDALPELERRAAAQALAKSVLTEGATPTPPAVLADVVDQLQALPDAQKIVKALQSGEARLGRKALAALAERTDLSPRLSHHLALIEQRAALAGEERDDFEAAAVSWLRAWRHWLTFLAASPEGHPAQSLLLDDLFARHRRRLNDLLTRNAIDSARRYWNLIQELSALATKVSETLGRDISERVVRFRDELATDYLLTTREAMRYGTIPQGLHADYEKGLGFLRRPLSLDRDNVRLLTALVEVCNEWFLDLYNLGPSSGLGEQVERFTPFALQLARLVEDRAGDLAARAQLADFYKFRGFVAREREQKRGLYEEALRFNPGNDNVRNLLAQLEKPADAPKEDQ